MTEPTANEPNFTIHQFVVNNLHNTFSGSKHKFFTPFDSKTDFFISIVMPVVSSLILIFSISKCNAFILLATALAALLFLLKGLMELTIEVDKGKESINTSTAIMECTVALMVLALVTPILDIVSLVTRSVSTVLEECAGSKPKVLSI